MTIDTAHAIIAASADLGEDARLIEDYSGRGVLLRYRRALEEIRDGWGGRVLTGGMAGELSRIARDALGGA